MGYQGGWPIAVYVAFHIQQILDELPIRDHKSGIGEPFQTENASEFPSPFGQSNLVH